MAAILKAEHVSKQVSSPEGPLTILEDISLDIASGESAAIIGPSGAGKSTLLALLAGLDTPSAGRIWLGGTELTALDEDGRAALRSRQVGFVFQSFHLLPSLTAIENVMLPLELKPGASTISPRAAALEVLEKVALAPRRNHYPRQLSGGEQQRVALARAFVTRPAVLFADEPTGNLDAATGGRVVQLLFDLNAASGTTLVLVTHEEAIARQCARMLRVDGGQAGLMASAPRLALATLARDWKSGELTVLLLAMVVAVAALTAVGFFTHRVNQAVKLQAAEVLAADLRLESSERIAARYFDEARRHGLSGTRVLSTLSVVFYGDKSQLTSLRMVGEGYPLRGRVRVAAAPFAPARTIHAIPARGEVSADSRLLAQLGAPMGSELSIGAAKFRVTRALDQLPDQGSAFAQLAPNLLMNLADEAQTQLIQPGSRATDAALFAGPRAAVEQFKDWLERNKQPGERLRDIAEASPQVETSSDRAGRFLDLAALVSVLLAAVAVAMAARRYAGRHLDGVALMKSMGASQRFILAISLYELLLLALISTVIGTLAGYFAQEGLAWLLKGLIHAELPPPSLQSAWLGLITAVAVSSGFALPPLLQLRQVPPLRVLRRDVEPPPLAYSITYGLAVGTVLAMLLWLIRDVRLVLWVAGSIAAMAIVLLGAGALLVRWLAPLRGLVGVAWRYGLANIVRRRRESVIQIAAFGLGLMVLLLLAFVRNDLLENWRASLPVDAPNHFFINIAPDEREKFQQFFVRRGVSTPQLHPMMRARLTAIDGHPVGELKFNSDRGRGFAEREQNLTWAGQPQADNTIVAGRWWTRDEWGQPLVSVATEYVEGLGLKLGDRLTFDVAGETIEARVASVRKVQWDRFQPNFFLVLPPGVLESSAGTYMTSLHLDAAQSHWLVDLVKEFPSVSIFDVDALLTQVREVMNKAALAVQYVFLFTLLAGVAVLLAAIQSTRDERRYESALLRTLGASRGTILQGVAAEFIVLGALAGILAAFGASAAGYFLATRLFSLPYRFDPWVWVAGLGLGVLLTGLSGTLATRSVVNQPPMATLRQGD